MSLTALSLHFNLLLFCLVFIYCFSSRGRVVGFGSMITFITVLQWQRMTPSPSPHRPHASEPQRELRFVDTVVLNYFDGLLQIAD